MKQDFLFEIGTEELPPKSLKRLGESLLAEIIKGLQKHKLSFQQSQYFAAPRRLAVLIKQIDAQQPDQTVERRGPSVKQAFDDKQKPTQAALGFAQSCGVSIKQLDRLTTEKGEWLYFTAQKPGKSAIDLLVDICQKAIKKLPIARLMRWGNHATEFVRPVHWLVMMFGKQVVPCKMLDLTATATTYGHRFHHPQEILLQQPDEYQSRLKNEGMVIADFQQRKQMISDQVTKLAAPLGTALIDESLLDEVTSLVEWPIALLGSFDQQFLDVPKEALISSMVTHQRYFAIVDQQQKLLAKFITVSNINSKQPQTVIEGNEKVIRARLADAQFFYQSDLKQTLASNLDKLNTVLFQKQLGTLQDKTKRITKLALSIASSIKANEKQVQRATELSKADLLTSMVGEFPELQGIMGSYYALHDKETKSVALALREQYLPRFANDELPSQPVSYCLAIADRIDTLVGIFGINQIPTGEKDPFGLRRAALGVLRIIIEKQLPIDLQPILNNATTAYGDKLANKKASEQVLEFMLERLKYWYLEQGYSADVFAAVYAKRPTQPLDFNNRIQAVREFILLPEAKALAAANKRVSNILLKQATVKTNRVLNNKLLEKGPEIKLAKLIDSKSKQVEKLYKKGDYTDVLTKLAELRTPIDHFFDHVMVMVDDEKLRNNRLALLQQLRHLFLHVADISLLQH